MKKLLVLLALISITSIVFTSCKKDEVTFDESLLVGKWVTGSTVYYKYLANHTGGTWDTSDDVSEAEAQGYNWTLVGDQLSQEHITTVRKVSRSAVRRNFYKIYTVTELTSSTLKYKDGFGNTTSFTKVKN